MSGYRVFSRKVYRREGRKFVPSPGGRRTPLGYAATAEEARIMCADGPANMALKSGHEYRHLPFYEFESVD